MIHIKSQKIELILSVIQNYWTPLILIYSRKFLTTNNNICKQTIKNITFNDRYCPRQTDHNQFKIKSDSVHSLVVSLKNFVFVVICHNK